MRTFWPPACHARLLSTTRSTQAGVELLLCLEFLYALGRGLPCYGRVEALSVLLPAAAALAEDALHAPHVGIQVRPTPMLDGFTWMWV